MGKISQKAGKCEVEVWTDGLPLWPVFRIEAINGEVHEVRVSAAHLHDLKYCIERVLVQLKGMRGGDG